MNRMNYYQGDRRPTAFATLRRGGSPINLEGATGVRLIVFKDGETATGPRFIDGACSMVSAAGGQVEYLWGPTDLDVPGDYWACYEIEWAPGIVETVPDPGYIALKVLPKSA